MVDNNRKLFNTDDDVLSKMRSLSNLQIEEIATGIINGSNKSFYSSTEFVPDTFKVYKNGIYQTLDIDYSIVTQTSFTFRVAPVVSDVVAIKYIPI